MKKKLYSTLISLCNYAIPSNDILDEGLGDLLLQKNSSEIEFLKKELVIKYAEFFVSIKNINKEKNVTIFLVEQNAKKALELADRAYVLVNGKVTIKGPGQELLKNKDIQAAYLEGGAKN